jgi:hypothetical protein
MPPILLPLCVAESTLPSCCNKRAKSKKRAAGSGSGRLVPELRHAAQEICPKTHRQSASLAAELLNQELGREENRQPGRDPGASA